MVLSALEAWTRSVFTRCARLGGMRASSRTSAMPRHFCHQHDIGVFADCVLHCNLEILDVDADLALVDQALVGGIDKLDRILDRQDVALR